MATPTHVQSTGWVLDVTNVVTLALTGVVSGNTLLVGIAQSSGTARTYTVTDDRGNTYTQRQRIASSQVAELWSAHNVAVLAGAVTITITASAGSQFNGLAVEVGNLGASDPFDVANQNTNTTTTSHFCAPAGSIDTAAEVYVFGVGTSGSTLGGGTAGANWNTLTTAGDDLAFAQYRISAGALTDERGPWTSGTSRTTLAVIASVKAPAGSAMLWHPGMDGGLGRPPGMNGGLRG